MKHLPKVSFPAVAIPVLVVASLLIWHDGSKRDQQRFLKTEHERLSHQIVNVVYARREIPKGAKLTSDMLEVRQVEAKNTFGSAVTDIPFAVGRVLRNPLHKDDVVETEYHLGLEKLNPTKELPPNR